MNSKSTSKKVKGKNKQGSKIIRDKMDEMESKRKALASKEKDITKGESDIAIKERDLASKKLRVV